MYNTVASVIPPWWCSLVPGLGAIWALLQLGGVPWEIIQAILAQAYEAQGTHVGVHAQLPLCGQGVKSAVSCWRSFCYFSIATIAS